MKSYGWSEIYMSEFDCQSASEFSKRLPGSPNRSILSTASCRPHGGRAERFHNTTCLTGSLHTNAKTIISGIKIKLNEMEKDYSLLH